MKTTYGLNDRREVSIGVHKGKFIDFNQHRNKRYAVADKCIPRVRACSLGARD